MPRGVGGKGPANIMQHIDGINFPATKQDIIDQIELNRDKYPHTDDVLEIAQQIPGKEYLSSSEILEEVGKIE
ncbi:MAG: DUF2795 domain-containing protein [Patescibacteria group bacterium]